jgi:transcriptional regulator with XRE-family HTH domain
MARSKISTTAPKGHLRSASRIPASRPSGRSEARLAAGRESIAKKVRELRVARRWTLAELSSQLQLSPSRLSEIERGAGSFAAEQFLLILQLFNVTVSDFVKVSSDPTPQLQNALARLGAFHLQESAQVPPSAQIENLHDVIREALIHGSPRIVTAIAPVLVRNVERLRLTVLYFELARLGLERRLAWVVANTMEALAQIAPRSATNPREWTRLARRAKVDLGMFLDFVGRPVADGTSVPLDAIDPTIRSKQTLDDVRNSSSNLSQQWRIVSNLQPRDFAQALRAADEQH